MAQYKQIKDPSTGSVSTKFISTTFISTNKGTITKHIPLDEPDNTDYIEYKAWIDAGNTPEAPD